ncbi:MAG: RNA polymerase sigma factor [Acidimicrobiia bacterium]
MIDQVTDAEIIRLSLNEPDRFSAIFDRHYRSIYRFIVGAVGRSDGPDLAAEVFARAFEFRRRFDSRYESAGPWLYGIAANLINDYYRKRARQFRAYRRIGIPSLSEPDIDEEALARVLADVERPHIAAAVLHLRVEEARVVLLFALEGLSYSEIAAALRIPEGTVRSRLSRGRTRLRNLMIDSGEVGSDG